MSSSPGPSIRMWLGVLSAARDERWSVVRWPIRCSAGRADALGVGGRVTGALEHVLEVTRPAAVAELVGVADRRNRVGAEHVLAPLGKRLPLGVAG